jgi:hypothetical protein
MTGFRRFVRIASYKDWLRETCMVLGFVSIQLASIALSMQLLMRCKHPQDEELLS